ERTIVVEAPEKAVVVAHRFFLLFGRVGVGHLGDSSAVAANVHSLRTNGEIAHVVFRVEDDADDLLHEKLQIDIKAIPRSRNGSGTSNRWPVDVLITVVGLHQRNDPLETDARGEHGADPVVTESIG